MSHIDAIAKCIEYHLSQDMEPDDIAEKVWDTITYLAHEVDDTIETTDNGIPLNMVK